MTRAVRPMTCDDYRGECVIKRLTDERLAQLVQADERIHISGEMADAGTIGPYHLVERCPEMPHAWHALRCEESVIRRWRWRRVDAEAQLVQRDIPWEWL